MKCPKCGYVSFDSNVECPKCRYDLTMEQSKLNLPSFKPSPPFLLGASVGNEDHPDEGRLREAAGAGGDDSARSIEGANRSIGVDGDPSFEEGVAYEATEGKKNSSNFPAPPPYFSKQIEEIKELISELMPKNSKTALDQKMDDHVVEHDFGISRGDSEFVPGDKTVEDNIVERKGHKRS